MMTNTEWAGVAGYPSVTWAFPSRIRFGQRGRLCTSISAASSVFDEA